MAIMNTIDAATTTDGVISLNDLLYALKVTQRLGVFDDAIKDTLILREVAKQGITVSDNELQRESDMLRKSMGLHRAADTHAWLQKHAMTEDDLEMYLTRLLAGAKLKEKLTADRVESYFAANRPNYDSARIRRIVVQSQDHATQLVKKLKSGHTDFESLALEYSMDRRSREFGGAVGRVYRMHLEPEVASAVFLANPGDVVGPIAVDSAYHIVRVDDVTRAKLDGDTKELVRDTVFQAWLSDQMAQRKVQFRLPELIAAPPNGLGNTAGAVVT